MDYNNANARELLATYGFQNPFTQNTTKSETGLVSLQMRYPPCGDSLLAPIRCTGLRAEGQGGTGWFYKNPF